VNEQNRAQQSGFTGVITKPIVMEDVKAIISRGLNLDTSCKYFEERDGVLALKLPFLFTPDAAAEIMNHLETKILEAVDSGLEGIVIDLSELKHVDAGVINLAVNAIQLSRELTLEHRIIGSELVCQECRNFEETKDWKFVNSFAEALEALKAPAAEP
jgi:two-component system, cell cycle response regulator